MEEKFDIKKLFIFIIIILIVFFVFYGLTILITNNKKQETKEETTSNEDIVIDYETILAKNIYNQKEESYYVLATKSSDDFSTLITNYQKIDNALKIYYVDLDSAFNQNYVSNESNFDLDYPIFKEATLLKIENKKITDKYEGKEDIESIFNILTEN